MQKGLNQRGLKVAAGLLFVAVGTAAAGGSTPRVTAEDGPRALSDQERQMMSNNAVRIADAYYAAFNGRGSVAAVPMRDDLRFVSPRFTLTTASSFKAALTDLFKRVKHLQIGDQVHNGDTVLTFYELDLGTPDGPIPMAERLRIEGGELAAVDLIFDSARLPPAPPAAD